MPDYRRQRIATPDGDFLDLDWVDQPNAKVPIVVLFHGLEGSSHSHYACALMHAVAASGWNGVVVHFRGCSGTPNLLPRAYHSGDSTEVDWILNSLKQQHPNAPLFTCGVSLGGNALLKWLGEKGTAATSTVTAAAAMSVPYSLAAANEMLSHGMGLLYARHFLKTLIPKSLAKAQRFPGHPGLNQPDLIQSAKTLRDFDDAVTAPLHGFRDADHYYSESSSGGYLHGIQVSTLLLHARNDPFLPESATPKATALPSAVRLYLTKKGGHAAFVSGRFAGNVAWPAQKVLEHFAAFL